MLTAKEQHIITALRREAGKLFVLAKKQSIPPSTLYDLIHRLEDKGIIKAQQVIDFAQIGFPIRVFIIISTTKHEKEKLESYLKAQESINNLYIVNNGTTFFVEAIFRQQKHLENYLEDLENQVTLTNMNVYTLLETLIRERFLTEEKHFV
jgi:DNA-binding Lrp family transcriptional regulator